MTGRPLVVVSRFLPDAKGSASARLLHGFVVGARALGRPVQVLSWWPGPQGDADLSDVDWRPLPAEPYWRTKARALVHPRADVLALDWDLPPDAVVVAEEPLSFPAVRRHPRAVLTVHYSPRADHRAVGGAGPQLLQDLRALRQAVRHAAAVTAYSSGVAADVHARCRPVPAAIAVPAEPAPVVDDPVAVCVANWDWPANRAVATRLYQVWPQVSVRLPDARLRLAGPGELPAAPPPGVEVRGPVPDSAEVLGGAAALVFPCPPTTGPKVKVLEAAARGLPVLTTPAGLDGIELSEDSVALVAASPPPEALAAAIVDLLRDGQGRRGLAARARAEVSAAHAPEVAAGRRLEVIEAALA